MKLNVCVPAAVYTPFTPTTHPNPHTTECVYKEQAVKTIQIVAVAAAKAGFGNTVTRQTLLTRCKAMAKRLTDSAIDQGIYLLKGKGLLKSTDKPGTYTVHLAPARVPTKPTKPAEQAKPAIATLKPIPPMCQATPSTKPSTMPALSFTETGITLKMGDVVVTISKV